MIIEKVVMKWRPPWPRDICRLRFQTTNNRWWQLDCLSSKFSNVAWSKKFDYVFCCIKSKKFCHFNCFHDWSSSLTYQILLLVHVYNSARNVSDLLQCNLQAILIIMADFITLRTLSLSQRKPSQILRIPPKRKQLSHIFY